MTTKWIWLFLLAIAAFAKDSCLECHSVMADNLQKPAQLFPKDIHSQHGFHCNDCHGGDPNQDDPEAAMNRARGFLGKVPRTAIPKLCARCHSDPVLMHKYRPQQRVDQLALYQTSVHGKRLAAGDTAVATCIDCHSVHDIREVRDSLAPVFPLRLPATCARCHADPKHMAPYKIPTDQYAGYQTSVHWEALSKGGDLSAPTCATCHGNHGASPPQVSSVADICGTCHVNFEQLFNKSPHQPAFAAAGVGGCVVCHSNHAIHRPSSAMLAGPSSVCSQCHTEDTPEARSGAEMAGLIRKLSDSIQASDGILERARRSGMEVAEALLRQADAKENLIKSRVAVHAFDVQAVRKPVDAGLVITAETWRDGESALRERDRRRIGLGVSLVAIMLTMSGLWIAIRTIESREKNSSDAKST
jgi:hypothetical protein